MVFTRSKARQGAEDPPPLQPTVKKKTRKSAVQAKPDSKPVAVPCEESETDCEPTIEQLALRALQVMKARLGVEPSDASDEHGVESGNSPEQDVMMLETKQQEEPQPKRSGLFSTSLQPCMKERPYFSTTTKRALKSSSSSRPALPWGESEKELMKKSVITSDFEKREVAPPMYVSKYAKAKARKEAREKSAGRGWYEMPAPEMTNELKNDLKLLRMRNALNPSQHYKASDWKTLPRYFQVGRVVSGPAEFYSSRVPKRQRKQTIMDELLHDHQFRKYHKKKYSALQRKFTSGTQRKKFIKHKRHYKK